MVSKVARLKTTGGEGRVRNGYANVGQRCRKWTWARKEEFGVERDTAKDDELREGRVRK